MRGTAKITVSKKLAKKLGLNKRTLATRAVKFKHAGSTTVKLKPSSKVRRALRNYHHSVKVTLGVSLRATGKSTKKSTSRITLARSK
jgi:hypothetical protein